MNDFQANEKEIIKFDEIQVEISWWYLVSWTVFTLVLFVCFDSYLFYSLKMYFIFESVCVCAHIHTS